MGHSPNVPSIVATFVFCQGMKPLQDLFHYEEWATRRLFDTALRLPERPERADLLCAHLLCAQRIWISRILQEESPVGVWEPISPLQWIPWLERNLEDLRGVLISLTPGRIVTYQNSKGISFRNTLEDILQHLLLHGAYHRGQIAQLLKPVAGEIPYTDYIFFARQDEESSASS